MGNQCVPSYTCGVAVWPPSPLHVATISLAISLAILPKFRLFVVGKLLVAPSIQCGLWMPIAPSIVLITVTTFASSPTPSEHPIQWKRLLQATAIALLREIPSYLVLRCGGFQIVEKAVAAMTLVIAAVAKEYSGHSHHPHACATFLSKLKNDSNAKRHDKYVRVSPRQWQECRQGNVKASIIWRSPIHGATRIPPAII